MVNADRHAGLRINLLDLEVLPAYDDFETAGADLLKCSFDKWTDPSRILWIGE